MNANSPVDRFPELEPEIRITAATEKPFEVVCQQLLWWFAAPQVGQQNTWASYNYPDRRLTRVEDIAVVGRGSVYGEDAAELHVRSYRPDGALERESYGYGDIRENMARWFGWWNLGDDLKFYTYRDEGFQDDWQDTPVHFVDAGGFHWLSQNRLVSTAESATHPGVNPNGAGLWDLQIGGATHRCLRVIEAPPPGASGVALLDGFLSADGKVVLFRQWRHEDCVMSDWPGPAREVLTGSPVLQYNDTTYHLYYNSIAEASLLPAPGLRG